MKLASRLPGEINNPVLKRVNGRWWERKSVNDMHKYSATQKRQKPIRNILLEYPCVHQIPRSLYKIMSKKILISFKLLNHLEQKKE